MKITKFILLIFTILIATNAIGQNIANKSFYTSSSSLINLFRPLQMEEELDLFQPNLDTLNLGFDLMLRPEDFDAGNFLAIGGIGTYQRYLWGIVDSTKERKNFRGMFEFNLKIQAPSTGKDSSTTLNRLYSSGSVGSFYGVLNVGYISKLNSNGVTLSLAPILNWQDSKVLTDTTSSNFGFFSIRTSLSAWTGPVILNATLEYYKVFGAIGNNIIAAKLNESINIRLNAGIHIGGGYYTQITYAIPANNPAESTGLFEISLTKNLAFK